MQPVQPVLALTGYQPPKGSSGSTEGDGLELVDFWALAPHPAEGEPLVPCWWSFRTAKRATLLLESAPLDVLTAGLPANVRRWRLLLIDNMGHRTEQSLPAPRA